MKARNLKEEINIELESIETVIQELKSLYNDVAEREPTVREKTAAAAFIAQFYNGIENILKRISHFNVIPLPKGEAWHIELFKRFCSPPYKNLPVLFDEDLALLMASYRKFRHVFYHGYSFRLEWDRLKEGIEKIEDVFTQFRTRLFNYIRTLEK